MLNPPFLPDFFNAFPGWPDAFAPSGFPVLTVTQQKLRTPYAQHYNLMVQHQLPGKALLEFGYVGTSGTKLPRFRQMAEEAGRDPKSPAGVAELFLALRASQLVGGRPDPGQAER